jgi:hypothetical protein
MKRTINFLFNLGDEVKEKKLSIGFLIDLSHSMQGEPLDNLKKALLQLFKPLVKYNPNINSSAEIPAADEVMLMTFATEVHKVCPWVQNQDFDFFSELLLAVPEVIFSRDGATALYDGLYSLITEFSKAKKENEKILIIFSDGGEYKSKKKKEEIQKLIYKYRNGFVSNSLYNQLSAQISKHDLEKIFEKSFDDDYIFRSAFEKAIIDLKIEVDLKDKLFELQKDSITNIHIYSLFYVSQEFKGDKNLLEEFSHLTDGKVYNSPNEETIPAILDEMIMDIIYEDHSSIRTKLYKRLKNYSSANDWFRLCSFNTVVMEIPQKRFSDSFVHPIYHLSLPELINKKNISRQNYLDYFIERLNETNGIYTDIKNCFNDMSMGAEFTDVENINNILVTLRGNDIIANSSTQLLCKTIKEKATDLFNGSEMVNIILVVLLDKFVEYSELDKKRLYAFLNEINETEQDEINAVYLISDINKYANNADNGFASLLKQNYEDLVVELLYSLSFNQDLFNKIIQSTVDVSGNLKRFIAIGGISVYLDLKDYIKTVSRSVTVDLLSNLFNENKIKSDEDFIGSNLKDFFNEIEYSKIKNELLDCNPHHNLIEQIDTPSIKLFTPFSKSKEFLTPNRIDPRSPLRTFKYMYSNIIDYISLLFYDVKEYVDVCHSIEFFEAELDRRLYGMSERYYSFLKGKVDYLLFEDDNRSSVINAKIFLSKLFERLNNFINSDLDALYQSDPFNGKLNSWEFELDKETKISKQDIEHIQDELKRKIQNFPLPSTVRFRYYSFALLLTLGLYGLITGLAIEPLLNLVSLLPFAIIISLCERKISMAYKQIQTVIEYYSHVHKYYSWQRAFGVLTQKIKTFYEQLLNKIDCDLDGKKDEKPFYLDSYNENQLIEIFKESCYKSIPVYYTKNEQLDDGQNKFHLSIKRYISKSLINQSNIFELLNKLGINSTGLENKVQLTREILKNNKEVLPRRNSPSVYISFLPPHLKNLSAGILSKLIIEEIIKENKYLITLLRELNSEEEKELINIFEGDIWKNKIAELIKTRKDLTTSYTHNTFSLWRGVVSYEIWLLKLTEIIQNQKGAIEFNTDEIFYFWKEMYEPRRKFKNLIYKHIEQICESKITINFNLMRIILNINEKETVLRHINGFSYPVLYINCNSPIDYPQIENVYSASASYNKTDLLKEGINFDNILKSSNPWEFKKINIDDTELYFNSFYYIDSENSGKYSILHSLVREMKLDELRKTENKDLSNYFLEDFITRFLNGKREKSNYKFLFDNM